MNEITREAAAVPAPKKTRKITPTEYIHQELQPYLKPKGFYIDATAGKGYDTLFLAENDGNTGCRVLAFDIQKIAIEQAKERIRAANYQKNVQFILSGHEHMAKYAEPNSVDIIMFNLGYLPGGDHKIATRAATTIEAIKQACKLIKNDGCISLCIYSGGDSGFAEKDMVLEFLTTLSNDYKVDIRPFDRPNNPPLPIFITKNKS